MSTRIHLKRDYDKEETEGAYYAVYYYISNPTNVVRSFTE